MSDMRHLWLLELSMPRAHFRRFLFVTSPSTLRELTMFRRSCHDAVWKAKRWLNGRTPTRAALDVVHEWYEDPVGCAK
eukprot:5695499-Amphidinium_carterae.1